MTVAKTVKFKLNVGSKLNDVGATRPKPRRRRESRVTGTEWRSNETTQ